jgi:predicted RNase H-like nuclease (RuvC/YqgF family)
VFTTRIESLEKTLKEQSGQIAQLSAQLEKAYQKVQDIAVKSVEGSSNLKSLSSLQQLVSEQSKRQLQEKS